LVCVAACIAACSPASDGSALLSTGRPAGRGESAAGAGVAGTGQREVPLLMAAGAAGSAPLTQPAFVPSAGCSSGDVQPFTLRTTTLDPSIVAASVGDYWGGAGEREVRAMVTVSPVDQKVYVGITRQDSAGFSAVIAAENSALGDALIIPNAILGGLAATADGLGALIYDPNAAVDMRMWAAVKRFGMDRTQRWTTELFHASNLIDEHTKANPARGRLGYVPMTDELVAYLGHMEMLQGTRHQGGYIATLSAAGVQTVNNKWFGSHNLDQRLAIVDDAKVAAFGVGDAYPRGFFASFTDHASPVVVYRVAASGDGAANGQVGSIIEVGDSVIASFVTDKSISQDLSAGDWPNIDMDVSMQIREAAADGVDVGFLSLPKAGPFTKDVTPAWATLPVTPGSRIASLKTVRYGKGDALLVAWTERSVSMRSPKTAFAAAVFDRHAGLCQPKRLLADAQGFTYDDLVAKPDGSIVWANAFGGQVHVVTLGPAQE
jgi:hypothetical protein